MTRGLSKQQRQILTVLKTKQVPNSDRGYFSTQEIVVELNPQYALWLVDVDSNPFTSDRKHHIAYQKHDRTRISVYRALRSLEKRGLVVSFRIQHSRYWSIPERLKDELLKDRSWTQKDYQERGLPWRWGAFVRTLREDLRLKYNLNILTGKERQDIKRLWAEQQKNAP